MLASATCRVAAARRRGPGRRLAGLQSAIAGGAGRIELCSALALGGLVAYVDSRPTWDDAGVTAGALFVMAVVFGYLGPARAWLWALALGAWIPLLGIIRTHNVAAVMVLVIAFAGAYAGAAIRTRLSPVR